MRMFYPKEYSKGLQRLVFAVSLAGTLVIAHSLAHTLEHDGLLWIWAAAANLVTMYFGVRTRLAGMESKSGGEDSTHSLILGVGDVFPIGAVLLFSPEAGALVAGLAPLVSMWTQLFQFRFYKWWFNGAQNGLMFFVFGKLLYWLLGQPPPLRPDSIEATLVLLPTLDLALVVMLCINLVVMSIVMRRAVGQSRSEVFAPLLMGSLVTFSCGNLALASLIAFGDKLALWLIPGVLAVMVSRMQLKSTVALNQSRLLLLRSLDALSSAIAVIDREGRIVATSEAWQLEDEKAAGLFGPGLATGADYLRFCREAATRHVAQGGEVAEGIRDVMEGRKEVFFVEYSCAPRAPAAFYALRVTRFDSPLGPQFVVAHQDVSERKKSEKALRDSERRYRRFFEEDLTGDFVADGSGILSDCNPALARMLDLPNAQEAVGLDLFSFFSEPARASEIAALIRRREKLDYAEIELNTNGGRTLNAVANLTAQRDAQGNLVEIKGYLFDDTRRKQLESALLQAQKMEAVGRLAGGIAHRFNNILTIITGYGELLREELGDHRQLARESSLILKAAGQGARLTERFVIFSGPQNFGPGSTGLDEALRRSLPVLSGLLNHRVRLTTSLDAPCAVPVHPGQVEQVVLNLVVNARDAMPEGGELSLATSIRSSADLPEACLVVSDTGTGIDEQVRSRLFEPFFTTKAHGRGTGLGLATVGEILRQSGGRVEVESKPGQGSTFRVFWPVVGGGKPERPKIEATALRGGGPEIVLVVEDERELRRMVGRILTQAGYRVLEAADGSQAIALASRVPSIDLLLTDVVMPGVGGPELADRMRRTWALTPKVLLMSGHVESASRDSRPEAWPFLAKPFGPAQLLTKVRETLDA